MKKPLSIYIHFPYCEIKCPFCNLNAWEEKDFDENTYTRAVRGELKALVSEMPELRSRYAVETVFMGGGTPSLFSERAVGGVLEFLAGEFEISNSAEISLEAHPVSCGREKMRGFSTAGINRLSIGAQSFSSEKLKNLGRAHEARLCFEAFKNAQSAGFQNISADIIAGAPGETPQAFEGDIKTAAATGVSHISVYGLEIERGTQFYALAKKGRLKTPSDEDCAQMIEIAAGCLSAMERYEISSFAAPDAHCRHNINYWRSGDYMGLGAGAHSHMTVPDAPFGLRWANPRNPRKYMEQTARGKTAPRRALDAETGFCDCVMMGLRLAGGMDLAGAEKRFGVRADGRALEKLENGGFVRRENGAVKITEKGFIVANSVIVEITGKTGSGE
ncbi:radical SAM family heme chaperone HemW [Candidatus Mycalebacterium sp.]